MSTITQSRWAVWVGYALVVIGALCASLLQGLGPWVFFAEKVRACWSSTNELRIGGVHATIDAACEVIEISEHREDDPHSPYAVVLEFEEARAMRDWISKVLP